MDEQMKQIATRAFNAAKAKEGTLVCEATWAACEAVLASRTPSVEKAAEAAYEEYWDDYVWAEAPEETRDVWRKIVTAAAPNAAACLVTPSLNEVKMTTLSPVAMTSLTLSATALCLAL